MDNEEICRIGAKPVLRVIGETAFFYRSGMSIDADGSPRAYGPNGLGLDNLACAGHPGNWWGVVTVGGEPVVQGPNDPAPGYYVSTTAMVDPNFPATDPRHYVDSESVPFIVLPPSCIRLGGAKLGDYATVVYGGGVCHAIFADIGPNDHLGEGSMALAAELGINPDPKHGGTDSPVLYIVYPGSGAREPGTIGEIQAAAQPLFDAWGGFERAGAGIGRTGSEGRGGLVGAKWKRFWRLGA